MDHGLASTGNSSNYLPPTGPTDVVIEGFAGENFTGFEVRSGSSATQL